MTVSGNAIAAESSGDFFKRLSKKSYCFKEGGKKVLKNPGRILQKVSNVGSAIASKGPKAAL